MAVVRKIDDTGTYDLHDLVTGGAFESTSMPPPSTDNSLLIPTKSSPAIAAKPPPQLVTTRLYVE